MGVWAGALGVIVTYFVPAVLGNHLHGTVLVCKQHPCPWGTQG